MHDVSKGNFYIDQLFQSRWYFFPHKKVRFCFYFPQGVSISVHFNAKVMHLWREYRLLLQGLCYMNNAFMDFLVLCALSVLRELIFSMDKLDRFISLMNNSLISLCCRSVSLFGGYFILQPTVAFSLFSYKVYSLSDRIF